MANRFAMYLRDLLPRTGRLIREGGEYHNDTAGDAELALYLFWQELPQG